MQLTGADGITVFDAIDKQLGLKLEEQKASTPVIVVDKVPVPGGGTYSARVLIYEKTYAGTWTGGDHGGLLNGVITNQKD